MAKKFLDKEARRKIILTKRARLKAQYPNLKFPRIYLK